MQRRVTKSLKCGICSFSCSDINDLQQHTFDCHVCLECMGQYATKQYHRCKKKPKLVVGGGGAAQSSSLSSSSLPTVPAGFIKTSSSFRDTIATYKHDFVMDHALVLDAVESINKQIHSLVSSYVNLHQGIRLKMNMEMLFEDAKTSEQKIKSYPSPAFRVPHKTFISQSIRDCSTYISSLCDLLSHEISGLILLKVLSIKIILMKYLPTQAKGNISLGYLKGKRGVLNTNVDKNCFLVSVLLCLYANKVQLPCGKTYKETTKRERERAKTFLESKKTGQLLCEKYPLRYADLNFGKDLSLLEMFEAEHQIGVAVYRYSKRQNAIITLRAPDKNFPQTCSLLMVLRSHLPKNERVKYNNKLHFAAIIDPNIFFNVKKKRGVGFCNKCSSHYTQASHVKACMTNQNEEYKFPKQTTYRFTELHKALIPETTFYFNFLYSNDSKVQNNIQCKIIGFGLLGVDANYNELFSHFYIGENATEQFYDHMLVNASFYLDKMIKNQLPLVATAAERAHLKTLKTCYICNRDFDRLLNVIPVINHHHHNPDIPKTFPCNQCNLKYYCLRKIFAFTFGLDICGKQLLANLSQTSIKGVHVIPKTQTDSFLGITLQNKFVFLGAENHISGTLYNAMDTVCIQDYDMLKKAEPEKYTILSKYLPFPHSSVHTIKDLEKELPSQQDFYDITYPPSHQNEAYDRAKLYYNMLNCNSLYDYAMHHLKASTYGLACVMSSYSKFVFKHYKLHPLTDISISSFSYSAMHYTSQANYQQLTDVNIFETLKENLIGGLSLSSEKLVACKSERLGDVCTPEEEVECLYVDYNKEFNYLLGQATPHSDYHFYSPEQVRDFKLENINKQDDMHYYICVDLHYPDSLKELTKSFPLCPTKTSLFNEQLKTLYAYSSQISGNDKIMGMNKISLDQYDKQNVWLSDQNLLLFLKLGMQLMQIKHVISFRVKRQFYPFHEACQVAAADAKTKFHSSIVKKCGINGIGVMMSRGTSERVTICQDAKRATKLLAKSNFVNAISINENMMCVSLLTKKTMATKNLMVAFWILQESKRLIYSAYYLHFLPVFRERLSCVMVETDGMIVKIVGRGDEGNFYSDIKKLSHVVEFSKVPSFITQLHDRSRENEPGMLKIENLNIRSVVSLRCKQYSVLTCNIEKCTIHNKIDCKICTPNNEQISKGICKAKFTHDRFVDILNSVHDGVEEYHSVTKRGDLITTAKRQRKFASVCDSDRIFVSKFQTIPLGFTNNNKKT